MSVYNSSGCIGLLIRPSFLYSYFCRCESALAVIICRTSGERGSIGSLGGKELMVISAPTVLWEVQPWDVSGGGAGYGSKERSKGWEWGSDGRQRLGSMSIVEFGETNPAVERTGARACANPSQIAL
jgi:hypothetical protein